MAGIQIIDPEERFELELEGATLVVRRVDAETLLELERRHGAKGPGRLHQEVLDYALCDWRGVQSPLSGTEVPCTRENKLRLPAAAKAKVLAAAQGMRAAAGG